MLLTAVVSLNACAAKEDSPIKTNLDAPATFETESHTHQPIVVLRTGSSELQVLTRLARTIEELEALIREAESSADPDARIRFDYYQLRTDILSILQGIHAHIQTPVYSPRNLDPIVGNYGR